MDLDDTNSKQKGQQEEQKVGWFVPNDMVDKY